MPVSMSLLICAGRRCSGPLMALTVLLPVCSVAQQTNLPLNQPIQPAMYLSCVYKQGYVIYLDSVFSVTPAEVGQAQSAWRQYAQSQAGNQPVSARCSVSRDQNSLVTGRQAERQALTARAGQQVKFVDVNWQFTSTQAAMVPQTRALTASPYGQAGTAYAPPAASYNQTYNQAAGAYNQGAGAYNQQAATPNQRNNIAQPGTAAGSPSPLSGVTSGFAQAGQSMKDNAMNTGTTMANNVSQMATDTTTQLQKSATDKLTSLLQRKRAKADAGQTQAQAQPGQAQPVASTNLVADNKGPAAPLAAASADTAAASPGAAQSGPSFAACHVAASDAEYLSEVFPVMEADETKLRYAFWQMVGQKYKNGPVAFSTVSCKRAATEGEAEAHRTAATDAAVQRGVTPDHVVKTGWSYMGQ